MLVNFQSLSSISNLSTNNVSAKKSVPAMQILQKQNASISALDALAFQGRTYLQAGESKTCKNLIKQEGDRFTCREKEILNGTLKYFETDGNPAYFIRQALSCNMGGRYLDGTEIANTLDYISNKPLKTQMVLGNMLDWKDYILFERTGADLLNDISNSPQEDLLLDAIVLVDKDLEDAKIPKEKRAQIIGDTVNFVVDFDRFSGSLVRKVAKIYANPNKTPQDEFDMLPVMLMSAKQVEQAVDKILKAEE